MFTYADKASSRGSGGAKFDIGKVKSVPDNDGEQNKVPHAIKVELRGESGSVWCPVTMGTNGDVSLPPEDSLVIVGYLTGDRPFAIPVYAGNEEVRSYEQNERIVGHEPTDSCIRIKPDGETTVEHESGSTVRLKSNGDVIINSDGQVFLGDESGTNPVARKGDSVEINDSQSGTETGKITGGSQNVESS